MTRIGLKAHWDNVYSTRQPDEVSWTQVFPTTSVELTRQLRLPADAALIDVGAGESRLAAEWLHLGFTDVTLLDISAVALDKAKERLSGAGASVKTVVTDVMDFHPQQSFDLWHDRATFHFLTDAGAQQQYHSVVKQCVRGYLIIGTFSAQGPERCSGLPVQRWTHTQMADFWRPDFSLEEYIYEDHLTPFGTVQNFLFCQLKRTSDFTATHK